MQSTIASRLTIISRYSLYTIISVLVMFSCNSKQENTAKVQGKQQPVKVLKTKYAKGFSIEDYGDFQVLHILRPFNDASDTLSYVLAPKEWQKNAAFAHLPIIHTPVNKMIVQSTTHVGLVAALDAQDKIIGMTSTQFVYHPELRKAIADNKLTSVGEGEQLNYEQVMVLQPDVMMVSGFSATSYQKNYKNLIDVNIPVLINGEWLEQSMLARTEWIKVIGYLIGEVDKAEKRFTEIEKQYLNYAEIGRTATEKPLVIGGLPYKGSWSVAGAKSYVAKLLTDAGATWNWSNDTSSVSLQMDFESVYPFGLKADYWMRLGGVKSKAELLAVDQRFADFKSVQNGNLYNNNKRMTEDGMGNDYWESGIANPHLVLGDIIKIIHPELLPDYELMYYKKIEE